VILIENINFWLLEGGLLRVVSGLILLVGGFSCHA
jgi:hypothetical protein